MAEGSQMKPCSKFSFLQPLSERKREKLLCCFQNSKKRLLGKKVCTSVFSQWHFKALTGGGMNGVRASPRAYGVIHGLVWLPDPSPTATTFSASPSGGAHC